MRQYKTVESPKHNVEAETAIAGRDGWRVHKFLDHHSDDSKIMIEFVKD